MDGSSFYGQRTCAIRVEVSLDGMAPSPMRLRPGPLGLNGVGLSVPHQNSKRPDVSINPTSGFLDSILE